MRNIIITGILMLSLAGCEKVLIDEDLNNDPHTNFEFLWETVDKKYAFFEYKNIDWDSVHRVYRPLIRPEMKEYELFDVLGEMLNELKDGHVNLRSDFDRSRYWDWMLDYPPNFNWNVIERNYLKDDYRITGGMYNRMIDSVGYVYYGSFSSPVTAAHMDTIVSLYYDSKGILFDIRDNGGGSLYNGDRIISRFIKEKTVLGYTRYKKGPGHQDFTGPIPQYLSPAGKRAFVHKPVIVLTNRGCYSAANDFASRMSALAHVILLGDKTGGGGGLPIYSELPNGWTFRFSSNISLSADSVNIENGVEPDVRVSTGGGPKDDIIERGIQLVHQLSE